MSGKKNGEENNKQLGLKLRVIGLFKQAVTEFKTEPEIRPGSRVHHSRQIG